MHDMHDMRFRAASSKGAPLLLVLAINLALPLPSRQ